MRPTLFSLLIAVFLPAYGLASPPRGFTLNAEVLERYGYTLDAYNAMDRSERSRVTEWVRVLEFERSTMRSVTADERTEPPGDGKKQGWDRSRVDAIAQSAGGALFDNSAARGGFSPDPDPVLVPSLQLRAGGLRRFSLTNEPHELRLSLGVLGADGESPLLAPSWYLNLEKGWTGSGDTFDYSLKTQIGAVDLGARLFYDDAPGLDARIDRSIDDLPGVIPKGGLRKRLDYSTAFERERVWLGSVLGRFGRAYHLVGPVDVAWSAMGLVRVTQGIPNAALDQSVGLRYRTGPASGIGLYGGVTETAAIFSRSMWRDSLAGESLETDIGVDASPHATIAAWGKVPYLSGARYTAEAGMQWNPWTTVRRAAGSLSVPAGKGRTGVRGRWESERGNGLEFDRNKASAGLSYSPAPGADLFAEYSHDDAAFGNARVKNNAVMLGVEFSERQGRTGTASVTMESLFGGRDEFILPVENRSALVESLRGHMSRILRIKDALLGGVPGGAAGGWADIQNEWAKLDPSLKRDIEDAWSKANPGGATLDRIMALSPADAGSLNDLVGLLDDIEFIERIVVRAMRRELLSALSGVEVPVLGGKITLTAPNVIAAAHAYSLSARPLPPFSLRDAREGLDPFFLKQLNKGLGCPSGASGGPADDITECLLAKLPPAEQDRVRKDYGDDLSSVMKEAVQWPSDLIRREINALLLQVFLAAERLNTLSVDQGVRIGELNTRGLAASFAELDRRDKGRPRRVFSRAANHLKEELAARDADLRTSMTEYGIRRLDWLQSRPSWPAGFRVAVRTEDWPALLAIYGDRELFDLVLSCQGMTRVPRRERPSGVLIKLEDRGFLGGVSITRGRGLVEIALPPKPQDLKHLAL